jgi:carbonic anhydrase
MDPRLDPLAILGLELGEAAVLRNAGARASDEMLAALEIGRDNLGVDRVAIVSHTDCRAQPDQVSREENLAADAGRIVDLGLGVETYRYDVDTHELTQLS